VIYLSPEEWFVEFEQEMQDLMGSMLQNSSVA
jgi:hypothetical protein